MTVKEINSDPYKKYANKVATVESGNNPKAKNPNSTAGGLYQFIDSSFEGLNKKYNLGYSLEDKYNPEKATKVFELFTKENEKVLQPILGRELNDGDRYLAHFLGSGGASKFLKAYQQNPNAPINSVLSPQVIQANKGVFKNVNTVGDLYKWAGAKMGDITEDVTNYEISKPIVNFTPSPAVLQSLPDSVEKESKEVAEAKSQMTQQTNEYDFIKDFIARPAPQTQQIQQRVQEELPQIDYLGQYNQISQFIENPIMQQGGQIPVSRDGVFATNDKPVIVPSPTIDMKGVNYPIKATSLETGETKILSPNLQYYFNNTKNVLEIPLK